MNLYQKFEGDLQSLFSKDDKYTFLVGAGISMDPPSNIPSAREFVRVLIEHFAPEHDINPLLDLKEMRFELVIDKLYDNFDEDLKFLDYLELMNNPNVIHWFLAYSIIANCNVITTNFDYLIENALERIIGVEKKHNIIPIITKKDFLENQEPEVFRSKNQFPIYKIHGSKKNIITNEITCTILL